VQLKLEGISNAQVAADPDDLELVWGICSIMPCANSTPGSTVTLRLRDLQNGGAVLCVEDSARSIPAADLPHLFERFAPRQWRVRRAPPGVLAWAGHLQTIVEAYSGSIALESQPGQGTRVRVELPAVVAEAEGMPVRPEMPTGPAPQPGLPSVKPYLRFPCLLFEFANRRWVYSARFFENS